MALALLWPLSTRAPAAGPVSDPVTITDYRASYRVDARGELTATETVIGVFPDQRHGIFRYWDVANPNSAGVRQVPTITSVRMDGRPVHYDMLWRTGERFRVAQIGDASRYLKAGEHVFEIGYTVPGVLDPGDTGTGYDFASTTGRADTATPSAFFWNVVAPGWENVIERAEITVDLPAQVAGAQCSVGWDHGRACDDLVVDGSRVTLSATDLSPRTPVTVRAGVEIATPERAEVLWGIGWDRVFGRSVAGAAWVFGAILGAGIAAVLAYRFIEERTPAFPLQYAPPDGLGPVQCEYIRTKSVGPAALTATVFHLADRGLVTVQQSVGRTWSVLGVGNRGEWKDVDQVSLAVARALGIRSDGDTFTADGTEAAGRRAALATTEVADAARRWAFGNGYLAEHEYLQLLRVVNVLALGCALLATVRLGFPSTVWMIPFAIVAVATVWSWRGDVTTRRTGEGRRLWSQAGGFHRMLVTDSAEARFDFAARTDLYATYLPYALAAGAARKWADKYRIETGFDAPSPEWLHLAGRGPRSAGSPRPYQSATESATRGGAASSTPAVSLAGFNDFESSLSRSIGAYTEAQNTAFAAAAAADSGSESSWGGLFSGGGSRSGWGSGSRRRSSGFRSGGGRSGGGGRGGGGGGGGSW